MRKQHTNVKRMKACLSNESIPSSAIEVSETSIQILTTVFPETVISDIVTVDDEIYNPPP